MKLIDFEGRKLNTTEMFIFNFINEKPEFFFSHTITEVSKEANVSAATITRTCQKFGFTTFKNLQMFVYEKFKLQDDYYKLSKGRSVDEIIHNVQGSTLYTINETLQHLDKEVVQRISDKLYKAKKITIFGVEQQELSAAMFAYNLNRIGIFATAVTNVHTYTQSALFFDNTDISIFISRTGWTKEVIECAKFAYARNLPVIILTVDKETTSNLLKNSFNNKISDMLEVQVINADKNEFPSISSLPGEMIIFDLLFNMLIEKNDDLRKKLELSTTISINWNFKGEL